MKKIKYASEYLRVKAWRAKNPKKFAAQISKHYQKHKEEIKAKKSAIYFRNKAKKQAEKVN